MKKFYSKFLKADEDNFNQVDKERTDGLSQDSLPKEVSPQQISNQPRKIVPKNKGGDHYISDDLTDHSNSIGFGEATKPSESPTSGNDGQTFITTQTTLNPSYGAVSSKPIAELQKDLQSKIDKAIQYEDVNSLDSFLSEFKKDIPGDPVKYVSLNPAIDQWVEDIQKQKENKQIGSDQADALVSRLVSLKDDISVGKGAVPKDVKEFREQALTGTPELVQQIRDYDKMVANLDEFTKSKLAEISSRNQELSNSILSIKKSLGDKAQELEKKSEEFQSLLAKNQEINLKIKDLEIEKTKLLVEKAKLTKETEQAIQQKYPDLNIFEDKRQLKDQLTTELLSNLKAAFRLSAKNNVMITESNDNFIYSYINYPDNAFKKAAISHVDQIIALLSTLSDTQLDDKTKKANMKKLEDMAAVLEKFMEDGEESHKDYINTVKQYVANGENLIKATHKFSEMMTNIESAVFNNFSNLSNTYIALQKENLEQLEKLSFESAEAGDKAKPESIKVLEHKKSYLVQSFSREAGKIDSVMVNIAKMYDTIISWLSETKDYLSEYVSSLFDNYNTVLESSNKNTKLLEKELQSSDFYKLAKSLEGNLD